MEEQPKPEAKESKSEQQPDQAQSKIEKIEKTMTIGEVLKAFPESGMIMMKHGLHCIGCHVAFHETLEQGCKAHGMSDEQVDKLVDEINNALQNQEKQ